ncbi:MAG: OadG family protein [Clostridia bacterium]|nr:OadG family protein [Clostridia bacterium]
MFNLLTNALPEGGRYIEIPESLLYALIGFLVVFAGISLLIAVVWAVGKVMSAINPTAQPKAKAKVEKPAQTAEKPVVANSDGVDEETVAVITAALMAYYQNTNPQCGFTVKRIKRI